MIVVSCASLIANKHFDTLPEALLWIAQQSDEFELKTYHIWDKEEQRPVGSLTV